MYHDPRLEDRFSASIIIRDFDCLPAEITRQIGINPTKTYVKGKYRIIGKKRKIRLLNKFNQWFFESKLSKSEPLEKHIQYLLDKIRPLKENFTKISKKYTVVLSSFMSYSEANPGFTLESSIINELAQLNTTLDFDIYCLAGVHSQFEYPDSKENLVKYLSRMKFISRFNSKTHNESEVLADSLIGIDKSTRSLDMNMEDLVFCDDLTDEEYHIKFERVNQNLRSIIRFIKNSKYLRHQIENSKQKLHI